MKIQGATGRDLAVGARGEALVGLAGSAYEEAVLRGDVYAVANQAGVTSQAGLSVTTPVLTLANPVNSGVYGVLWNASAVFLVAFGAAAAVWLAFGRYNATAVTGTLTTAHVNLLTGQSQGNKINAYLAATLPAAPVAIDQLGVGLTGAITTVPALLAIEKWYNGSIIIPPGCNISVQTSTASGASGQLNSFIWEERIITT